MSGIAPPPRTPPTDDDARADDTEGCGWLITGCLLPRAVGCLVGVLIILGILGWLWISGQL
jgi:hypothetical protein